MVRRIQEAEGEMSERGEYRAIYTVLIDSPEYLKLKPGGRLMLFVLKLRLGPSGIGVIPAMLANLSEASGMTAVQTSDALSELEGGDWIRTEGNIVWIVNGLKYEPSISSKNINHRASVISYLKSLPRLKIVDDFRRYYADWLQIELPDDVEPPLEQTDDLRVVPAKEKAPKKPKPISSSWVADGVKWWNENVGTINHGRFGTALKLLVDKYGWERVFAALQTYVANEDKQVRIEWFAANGVRLLEARPSRGPKKPQWQQAEEDEGIAKQPGVGEAVKAYIKSLNGEGEEWWTRMRAEAKSAQRHALVYAWEHLPKDQT
jgi:hypothetical protein